MDTVVLIVAAGRGHRAQGTVPKQYEYNRTSTMLNITIHALLKSVHIDAIVVVINPLDIDLYLTSTEKITDKRLLKHCFGGVERTESVRYGLEEIKKYSPKNILIHDAARPFVTANLIDRIIDSLKYHAAVLPVLPIVDAVWEKSQSGHGNNSIKPGPDRSKFLLAQTPQGFDFVTIYSAYQKITIEAVDDVTIAYKSGTRIHTVLGDIKNVKVTSKEDLQNFKGIK